MYLRRCARGLQSAKLPLGPAHPAVRPATQRMVGHRHGHCLSSAATCRAALPACGHTTRAASDASVEERLHHRLSTRHVAGQEQFRRHSTAVSCRKIDDTAARQLTLQHTRSSRPSVRIYRPGTRRCRQSRRASRTPAYRSSSSGRWLWSTACPPCTCSESAWWGLP